MIQAHKVSPALPYSSLEYASVKTYITTKIGKENSAPVTVRYVNKADEINRNESDVIFVVTNG
jgi:hypothetical protein